VLTTVLEREIRERVNEDDEEDMMEMPQPIVRVHTSYISIYGNAKLISGTAVSTWTIPTTAASHPTPAVFQ